MRTRSSRHSMLQRRMRRYGPWLGMLALAPLPPASAGPLLHEHFADAPEEDAALGATTWSGDLPLVLTTRSGTVTAPPESTPSNGRGPVYGESSTPASARYELDGITTAPESVAYDDPFRPSTAPYKRLHVFDTLEAGFELGVRDPTLHPVQLGGQASDDEDVFFAELDVQTVQDVPVRIVSVASGAHVLALHTNPPSQVSIVHDSAENWFVLADQTARLRLVLQVAAPRRAFGAPFQVGNWNLLRDRAPPLPPDAKAPITEVLHRIGVDPTDAPTRALQKLVSYFRNFQESDVVPRAQNAQELYRELSLAQRGICRHRSFAFVVTALGLGLPARLVVNEAHAWVEVDDGVDFLRIDLGGAATRWLGEPISPDVPLHETHRDPFPWPPGQRSGSRLRNRARAPIQDSFPSASSSTHALHTPLAGSDDAPNAPTIELSVPKFDWVRGELLRVEGRVGIGQAPCSFGRVDLAWRRRGATDHELGSVATDRDGRFRGQVNLPPELELGEGEIVARSIGPCSGAD